MTTLTHRPNTAVMVIDVRDGVVDGAYRRDAVVAAIAALVARAREEKVPVVWVQHSDDGLTLGSPGWNLVPELPIAPSETLVHKEFGDAFEDTELELVLAAGGVGRLVVAGAETDACIRSTIHGAFTRGYDVTLVGDAHTTGDRSRWGAPAPEDVVAHANLYWANQKAPGRTASVVDAVDVQFSRNVDKPAVHPTGITPNITVTDIDAARDFYSGFLGFTVEAFDLGWVTSLQTPDGGASLLLVVGDATSSVDSNISVHVGDQVEEAYEDARRRGYDIVHPLTTEPWGVRRFFVRAPDGTVVNIVSHTDDG